jgi:hypothetical protein
LIKQYNTVRSIESHTDVLSLLIVSAEITVLVFGVKAIELIGLGKKKRG